MAFVLQLSVLSSSTHHRLRLQSRYKEEGLKDAHSCLYSLLPVTMEMQHARDAGQLLSQVTCALPLHVSCAVTSSDHVHPQVKHQEDGGTDASRPLFATLPDTRDTSFAREMTDLQSEVGHVQGFF